ncbi:MAG: molybdopterin biosynthesis protein [Firmicutes bacterium]|nr:molybdopterin biosynthesis protein [Bacillota bacterium]
MRKIYLYNIPRRQALQRFLSAVRLPRRIEKVKTAGALGRVTAEPLFARLSMPSDHAAAMDGFAVRAERTFTANDRNPLQLLPGEECLPVDTGEPLPPGFDAVIKVEDILMLPDGGIEILAPATPWQHLRSVGEDLVAGELLLPALHRLRPHDLGVLLAGGITTAAVLAKPKAVIIPTGTELIPPEEKRHRGDVPDFNSTVIAAYLQQWGAETVIQPIVPDDQALLKEAASQAAAEGDLIIIIAGSSAGRSDYTVHVIEALGEVFVHGVSTRPGKPVILGQISGKPALGIPGYPVSAYLSLEWFVRPLIYRGLGQPEPARERLRASLGRRIVSEIGVEEHVRMAVGCVDDRFVANPLERGAGITMSLVRADGLLIVPAESVGFEQGETVELELFRSSGELRNNLLAAGSHDLIVDLLATALKEEGTGLTLSSAHLGSMGGIGAIGSGQAHLAGVHLFDPASGEYNTPYIERLLPGKKVHLINLAYRVQGWIVPPENPDGVERIDDIASKGISFVNRQKGAGTRILFDHLLEKAGLTPDEIPGYEREEHTHLGVAAAVSAGTARIGLGILPAARAFGLEFIPLCEERYDLLMNDHFYRSGAGEAVLKLIRDPVFQKRVEAMGGYSMRDAGKLIN